jgi:hypothetical protein
MFSPFEGGEGDDFIVFKTEFLLFKIKIIPLAPFKRGKTTSYFEIIGKILKSKVT